MYLRKNREENISLVHKRLQQAYAVEDRILMRMKAWWKKCPGDFWGRNDEGTDIIYKFSENMESYSKGIILKDTKDMQYLRNYVRIVDDDDLALLICDEKYKSVMDIITGRLKGNIPKASHRQDLIDEDTELGARSSHTARVIATYENILIPYLCKEYNLHNPLNWKDLLIYTIEGYTYYLKKTSTSNWNFIKRNSIIIENHKETDND